MTAPMMAANNRIEVISAFANLQEVETLSRDGIRRVYVI